MLPIYSPACIGAHWKREGPTGPFRGLIQALQRTIWPFRLTPPTATRIDFLPIGPCLTARHFPPPVALIELWLTLKKATNLSDGDNPKDCSDAISPNASEKRRVALSAKAGTRTQLECSRNASDARHCAENATAPPLSIAAYEMEACAKSPTKDFPSLPNQPEC